MLPIWAIGPDCLVLLILFLFLPVFAQPLCWRVCLMHEPQVHWLVTLLARSIQMRSYNIPHARGKQKMQLDLNIMDAAYAEYKCT